jgi:CO/xanthine dehydrogenase Mo-binding subunit
MVEIGQGIISTLAQIAAEELDVDYTRIRMIPADTGRSPTRASPPASRSTVESGSALRQAFAEVRRAFLDAAALRLGVAIDELFVRDGTIHRRASNESATYWELSWRTKSFGSPLESGRITIPSVGCKLLRPDAPSLVETWTPCKCELPFASLSRSPVKTKDGRVATAHCG